MTDNELEYETEDVRAGFDRLDPAPPPPRPRSTLGRRSTV